MPEGATALGWPEGSRQSGQMRIERVVRSMGDEGSVVMRATWVKGLIASPAEEGAPSDTSSRVEDAVIDNRIGDRRVGVVHLRS